jgi:hypothetical protein
MKLLNPVLKKLHIEVPVVPHWVASLNARPFVKRNNAEFTNVRSFTSLLMFRTCFTLSCTIPLLALPTSNNFVQFVFAEVPKQSALGSSLGPLGASCLSGNCSWSELGSVVFWTFDTHDLSTRCRKLLNFIFCLCLVFCTQKTHWAAHSLADTIPTFSTTWQFSSKLSKYWGTGLRSLRPSWIHCTGQQHKVPLFIRLFFCLSFLCSVMLRHASCVSWHKPFLLPHLHRDVSLPPEHCLPFFTWVASRSRSRGMRLLALIVTQTLTFCLAIFQLRSHYHRNCLDRVWWFWPKFLSKSDNTVSSNFFPSAAYISMLQT